MEQVEGGVVRWSVKVSKDTDDSLRTFLAQRGLKKGALSKFVERAVQKEVFAQTVAGVQDRNTGVSDKEIEGVINHALCHVRAQRWGKPKARKLAAKKNR